MIMFPAVRERDSNTIMCQPVRFWVIVFKIYGNKYKIYSHSFSSLLTANLFILLFFGLERFSVLVVV